MVDRHRAGGAIPGDPRALLLEKRHELFDVGDVRHVEQSDRFVGQQRRAQDGQNGVFVARRRDGAGEGFATVDDEIGHWREVKVAS